MLQVRTDEKVNGAQTAKMTTKVDSRASVGVLRQPIPDQSELDHRFNLALVSVVSCYICVCGAFLSDCVICVVFSVLLLLSLCSFQKNITFCQHYTSLI